MTLVETADRITTGVQHATQRDVTVEQVAELKRVDLSLGQLPPLVVEALNLVRAATSSGISISTDGLASLRGRITDAVARADRGDFDTSALAQLILDARTEVGSVRSAVAYSWHEVVEGRVPQREGLTRLAETFLQLDSGNSLARELRQAVGVAQQISKASPSAEVLQRLEEVAAQIPELLRDLVGDNTSVRSFAERVARGGASLDSVTPEVKGWIASKGFEGSFKIVPGEPVL